MEEEHLEEEGQQELPNSADLNLSQRDISNFLRIPRDLERPRAVQRAKPLVDYSQSHQLNLEHHLLALQATAAKK